VVASETDSWWLLHLHVLRFPDHCVLRRASATEEKEATHKAQRHWKMF
jgi:hypothetical protein